MTEPTFVPLSRLRRVLEKPREEGQAGSMQDANRRRDGLTDTNELSPKEAVALSRSIKAMALKPIYPDSTELIRKDRDSR